MTINSDFFKIIKEGCPKAFSENVPLKPDIVFIDGQVKLMKAAQVDSWGLFFTIQFFKTIENSFALGAHTVVLGFDDYTHVPSSKNMTQVKRSNQKIVMEFVQSSSLPVKANSTVMVITFATQNCAQTGSQSPRPLPHMNLNVSERLIWAL